MPIVSAVTLFLLDKKEVKAKPNVVQLLILVSLFGPFYYENAKADWECTFFDVFPDKAEETISEGFCEGIRTNIIFKDTCEWIQATASRYSNDHTCPK